MCTFYNPKNLIYPREADFVKTILSIAQCSFDQLIVKNRCNELVFARNAIAIDAYMTYYNTHTGEYLLEGNAIRYAAKLINRDRATIYVVLNKFVDMWPMRNDSFRSWSLINPNVFNRLNQIYLTNKHKDKPKEPTEIFVSKDKKVNDYLKSKWDK